MQNARPRRVTIDLSEAEWLALSDAAETALLDEAVLARRLMVDGLGQLPVVFAAEPVLPAADADDPRERLMARYRPRDVPVLFLAEEDSAAGQSFYHLDSTLFRAVREAALRAFGMVPEGEAFLTWFMDEGLWLWEIPLTSSRPTRGRPRKAELDEESLRLARLLRELGPDWLIAVGTPLGRVVRRAIELAQFDDRGVRILPSPSRQWRRRFVDELARFLGEPRPVAPGTSSRSDAGPAMASLHDAMTAVLIDERGRRMTSREIANTIAARDLFRRADGRHPPASQVGARARRYPSRFDVSSSGIALRGSAS